jgi:CMP-N,N'-diacetyllegionaminic acid synthase
VRSVCSPLHTPFKMYRQREGEPYLQPILRSEFPDTFREFAEPYNMPRQSLPRVLRHSGYVDVIRPEVIDAGSMSGRNIVPLPFEEWRDVDIDTARDLQYAEMIIRERAEHGLNSWD